MARVLPRDTGYYGGHNHQYVVRYAETRVRASSKASTSLSVENGSQSHHRQGCTVGYNDKKGTFPENRFDYRDSSAEVISAWRTVWRTWMGMALFGGVEVTKQLLFGMEADVAARGIGTGKLLFIKVIVNPTCQTCCLIVSTGAYWRLGVPRGDNSEIHRFVQY